MSILAHCGHALFSRAYFAPNPKEGNNDWSRHFLFLKVFKFQYLVKKSAELMEVIVHEANKEEGEENKLSNNWIRVDMSSLRYKDLDLLEGIFKLWSAEGREAMSIRKSFDVRIRQLLGQRTDNKVSRKASCILQQKTISQSIFSAAFISVKKLVNVCNRNTLSCCW